MKQLMLLVKKQETAQRTVFSILFCFFRKRPAVSSSPFRSAMSDDDSGVDAGSDSNGSLSMSVGSSPSDNEQEVGNGHKIE